MKVGDVCVCCAASGHSECVALNDLQFVGLCLCQYRSPNRNAVFKYRSSQCPVCVCYSLFLFPPVGGCQGFDDFGGLSCFVCDAGDVSVVSKFGFENNA